MVEIAKATWSTMKSLHPLSQKKRVAAVEPVKRSKVVASEGFSSVMPTKKALVDATREMYNNINKPFEDTYGVNFAHAQTKRAYSKTTN